MNLLAKTSWIQAAAAPRDRGAVWSAATTAGLVRVYARASEIDSETWQRAFRGQVRDHRFYELTERHLGNQFDQKYFVLQDAATGATAVQPFFLVDQDLMAGLPMPVRERVAKLRRWWPNLFYAKMLMVGSPAGEGQLDVSEPWVCRTLQEGLTAYAKVVRPAIVMLKDFPSSYRRLLQAFTDHGFSRMPGLPDAKLDLDFKSFDQYMQQKLSKVFRKSLRRKFKALRVHPPLTLEVTSDLSACIDEIFPLYLQVYQRAKMTFEVLNRDYFLELSLAMPDRCRCFLWRQEGRVVAFNLCLLHNDDLFDLEVGFDYAVALNLHLYFVTWRDLIEWCLQHRIRTYHAGPLNYDPKLHFRLSLAPQDIYARHPSPWLNQVLRLAMRFLGPVRYEPLLRKFPNYPELFG
ncbi:MAG TPA: GNAT family N-acetyltransferase [Chthoniobacterales bacterium]